MKLLFMMFILYLCAVNSKKNNRNERKDIIIINDVKYFKKIMKTHTNLLVLFSQSEREVFDKLNLLGTLAYNIKGKGSVAFIDCGECSKLCKKFKISTKYGPVMKHYKNGKFNKDYDRKDTIKSLTNFMNDPMGDVPWEEEPGAETIQHLDGDKDFAKLINKEKKPIFVMFYAPWCGFCKRLKPVYQEIATEMRQFVLLAGMNVDKTESMSTRVQFNITGFPTLIYFKNGKELYRYKGKHEKEPLMEWLLSPSDNNPVHEEEEWKDTPSEVVHLTDETFDGYIASNPSVLVMFYAPWCGHCKAMKPEYVNAAHTLRNESINGTLAAVDATKETNLGERFKVKGFPTVKYFKGGKFAFDINERKANAIVDFMKDPKEPPPPPPAEPEWSELQTDVVHLQDDNFKDFIKKKKHVLVMFYAPWCGHCKKAKPEFTEAASHFVGHKKIAFSAVDCTKEIGTCKDHDVQGYPTFKYFNYGKNDDKYTGGRTKKDFVKFVNSLQVGSTGNREDLWFDESGAVYHLNDGNFDDFISKHDSVLVMFYAPWCSHSKAMKPTFIEAANELKAKKIDGVFGAVDCLNEPELRSKFEINSYPSVKYFKNGKYVFDYPRSRKKDDLVDFMRSPSETYNPAKTVKNELQWSDEDTHVVHLTESDFNDYIESHNSVLVMFYAPWCAHCKKTKPEYEKAAKKNVGYMAAVDCTKEIDLCKTYDIKGYPTIKYFKEGEDLFKYNLPRTAGSFDTFLKNPQRPEAEWSLVPGKVRHLNDDNFLEVLNSQKSVLVMFYSPRCGYCVGMKPDYIAAAQQLHDEKSTIILAAMDATIHSKYSKEHVTTGYPTIKFFRYGQFIEEYDGNRSKDDIIKFVKLKDVKEIDDNGSEKLNEFAAVNVLTKDTFEKDLVNVEHSLVMFYVPWCGNCKIAKPQFEDAAMKLLKENNKKFAAVDCSKETVLCSKEEINDYPTIKYYNFGNFAMKYEKSRTSEEFESFFNRLPSQPTKEEL